MDILTELKAKAKLIEGRIVLPESADTRTLRPRMQFWLRVWQTLSYGQTGRDQNPEKTLGRLSRATVIDPANFPEIGKFADFYYEKAQRKASLASRQARQF